MECPTAKPKRKKSRGSKCEETISLIESNRDSAKNNIVLSSFKPNYSETDVTFIDETQPLQRVSSPESDISEFRVGEPTELDSLSSGVANIAIAPSPDLSNNFDHYIKRVIIADAPTCDKSAVITQPLLFGYSDIEDEYSEVLKEITNLKEIHAFSDSQLLALYHNEELGQNDIFVDNFIDVELRSGFVLHHPLYNLLSSYQKSRDKLNCNVLEIDALIKESKDIQQRLWILEVVRDTEMGECQDGNPVEASHQYQVGTFDENVLNKLTTNLALVREKANELHALYSYSCLSAKLQIENYVRKLIASTTNLPNSASVSLVSEGPPSKPNEFCGAASVLFHFLRYPYKDQGFVSDCKNWLQNVVAALLRVASWREHIFLLNHILRCPGSVTKWATSYVQAPIPPFGCNDVHLYMDHMMCMVATIVSPIKSREAFLSHLDKSGDENDDLWVIIDSEGEDDDPVSSLMNLRENDIVALFNQIPLDSLFSIVFNLQLRDGKCVAYKLSGGQMLKAIAVTRFFIKAVGRGLTFYVSTKYQQFAKRLASTIVLSIQILTDVWELFRNDTVDVGDLALMDRLQVEYDNVIKNACALFISSPQKSVLQFLNGLPFGNVSLAALWRLLHMMMLPSNLPKGWLQLLVFTGSTECSAEWWEGVEELICLMNDAESCYFLTAICNMALSRDITDWNFIKMIAVVLLQVGFIIHNTKDICHKSARTQLSNMTLIYPSLITLILQKLKHFIPQVGNLSLYLLRDLPLNSWTPTKEDMELLEHWLLICPQGSIEGSLAIYILHNMNWGLNPNCSSQLFLSREIHCRVALLVVRLAILYCPESPSSSHSTVIADTIKQLTSSSTKLITEQTLNVWVWSMLFKLRLHLLDQPELAVWATLSNPLQFFSVLPSLESLPNELSPLIRALKENQVTALFTALSMTSTGHSIPFLCQSGFGLLETLVQCHRYLAVLALMEHIFPLFIDSPGSLLASDKFQGIILSLLMADRTFFKFALSLISSDFPGLILKQFGDLIEVHLSNYTRYNLISPAPLAEMWLRILTRSWLTEPVASSYLINKILSVSFFQPEMKETALDILRELLEAQTAPKQQRFSLLSWVTGSNPYGSLMSKSSSDTPWFSLFAIEVEQKVLFINTTLWDHLLVELSSSTGKTNVDSSLKKCCSLLKLSNIPSSTLPLYRWLQQVLDTPVDHPTMPIFWQKFFSVFLARVPTLSRKDVGSVGLKFFDGITYGGLLNKLKKKAQDCRDYYENKSKNTSNTIPPEKKVWCSNMVNLYTSYSLWLEDPTLHDPNVNLYALPASCCSDKLAAIFHGNMPIWTEFIDLDALLQRQRQANSSWQQSLCRSCEISSKPFKPPTVESPLSRIDKRLLKVERPLPPPIWKPHPILVTDVPTEILYNKQHIMEYLKDSFKALASYAQVYWMRSGELSSVDFSLLELAPQLYRSIETQVILHAACDTHNPGASHQQTMNSLTCAGPAVIQMKVTEVRVDSQIDMTIHNNRLEAQNLIKRCLQQPNQAVCIGSIQIQQTVNALEEKVNDLRRIGDIQLLNAIQEVGVSLFYYLTTFYTDKMIAYPPVKQLVTTSIETLGQCFISVDEQQGPVLLAQVLENPHLTPLLSTHFSPTTSPPQIYILLYRTLLNAVSATNADLIFVLLTKFDVAVWLDTHKPRLSERSQLIEAVMDALATAGVNPCSELIMIHEVLRRQLCALMMSDFSQHFHEVVALALRRSESHGLSSDVWFDVVNALVWQTSVQFKPHGTMAQVVNNMATFGSQQTVLTLTEIKGIVSLLSQFFTSERLQYGLYGLYPKYRVYVSPFTILLGVISHAHMAAMVKQSKNDPTVCAEMWPLFLSLFNPWICPYFTHDLAQPTAAWIQQLTDDRSVLLPWISADSGHAHKIAAIFTESIRFFLDGLQGNIEILSHVWQFYVINYAHTSIKEHILTVMNDNLLSLNWQRFSPNVHDLELMQKVSDTFVPNCHTFLGAVFVDVPWNNMIVNSSTAHSQYSSIIHSTLLHLLIKLSIEPNVRQSTKITDLLSSSKSFNWDTVDFGSYETVVNWFVMSYDPRVVLNMDLDDTQIDRNVVEVLSHAAGFALNLPVYHSSTPRKRQIFVRAYVKLITSCLSKYKSSAATLQPKIEKAIEDILVLINTVVPQTGGNYEEAGLLISEMLTLSNLTSGSTAKFCTDTMKSWLSKRGDCIVAAAILKTAGTTVEQVSLVGEIIESVMESIFNDPNGGDWDQILNYLQEPVPRNPPIENHLIENGQLLTFYALLCKRLVTLFDLNEELNIFSAVVNRLSSLQIMADCEKVVPLFHLCLIMGSRLGDFNPVECGKNLNILVHMADEWADHKPSWGFLGAIGIKRQHTLTNRMKGLCRVLSSLILLQLPEDKSQLHTGNVPFIRTTAQSPGGFTSNSMELGPSSEAHKSLLLLETFVSDKSNYDLRQHLEVCLNSIKKSENSLHNAHQLFLKTSKSLFPNLRYVQAIAMGSGI